VQQVQGPSRGTGRGCPYLESGTPTELDTGTPGEADVLEVAVRFAAPIPVRPVRPVRLIATGLGLPRAEVERLVADGRLVSVIRLTGKTAAGFTFTLKR
jgi:hypothetical protein